MENESMTEQEKADMAKHLVALKEWKRKVEHEGYDGGSLEAAASLDPILDYVTSSLERANED